MKKLVSFIFLVLWLLACRSKKETTPPSTEDSTVTETVTHRGWESVVNDSTGLLELKKTKPLGIDSLDASAVIDLINENTQNGPIGNNVRLVYLRTSHDTVYVKIPESTYLTQQMGSTGATMFLAEAVYNLTEIPGVVYANFDFEEGDHASPGTYNRESFRNN